MDSAQVTFDRVLSFGGVRFFNKNQSNSKYWLAFQILNFLATSLSLVFTTGSVIVNISDIALAIQGACVCFSGSILTLSLFLMLIYRNSFRLFLNEMVFKDAMLDMPFIGFVMENDIGKKLKELKEIVKGSHIKLCKYSKIMLITYVASVWLVITMYIGDSIYRMIIREDKALRLLAFDMWFPLSLENYNVYIGLFVFQSYIGYLCCVAYPGLHSTIFVLVGQIIRQLRILTYILLNLDDLVLEIVGERNDKWQQLTTHIVSQCLDHYIKIKRFSNKVNVICRPFYLAFILDSSVLICVCSVKIAISNKMALDTIKYYIQEFCFIIMVLMFCLLGQQVDQECGNLDKSLTEKWYIFNKKHLTHIKIFKMALSQKIPIFIFGSLTLSLPTFTWFIRNGMSFFTLVMSVLEE